jgi:hypothetical protein
MTEHDYTRDHYFYLLIDVSWSMRWTPYNTENMVVSFWRNYVYSTSNDKPKYRYHENSRIEQTKKAIIEIIKEFNENEKYDRSKLFFTIYKFHDCLEQVVLEKKLSDLVPENLTTSPEKYNYSLLNEILDSEVYLDGKETALFDALCQSVERVETFLKKPKRYVFLYVFTDGFNTVDWRQESRAKAKLGNNLPQCLKERSKRVMFDFSSEGQTDDKRRMVRNLGFNYTAVTNFNTIKNSVIADEHDRIEVEKVEIEQEKIAQTEQDKLDREFMQVAQQKKALKHASFIGVKVFTGEKRTIPTQQSDEQEEVVQVTVNEEQ